MRLGIMQPYFFPYIGYFALIAHTDEWIVFDVTQYTPKSWMNRNRVLHPEHGWNYVSVPLQHSSISLKTHEARVQDLPGTAKSVLGKLTHYRRQAPHYQAVAALVTETFATAKSDSLVDLNVAGMQAVCSYLDIPFRYRICSQLGLGLPDDLPAGSWAPQICHKLGANSYLNPAGGSHLFDVKEFAELGIELNFLQPAEFIYPTGKYTFEPSLSILDLMMWNSPDVIKDVMINKHQVVPAS